MLGRTFGWHRDIFPGLLATGRVLADAVEANRGRRYSEWIRLRKQPKILPSVDRPFCDKCLPNRIERPQASACNGLFGLGRLQLRSLQSPSSHRALHFTLSRL